MNPGDKVILKTVMQTQEITVDGELVTEEIEVGSVMQCRPGPRVDGPEFIVLNSEEQPHRWNAPLEDYDPDTVDDDPVNESRWVLA